MSSLSAWSLVSEPQARALRLYAEAEAAAQVPETDSLAWLTHICRNFERATGWSMCYLAADKARMLPDPLWSAPVDPGDGTPLGYLMIGTGQPAAAGDDRTRISADADAAKDLAGSLAELANQLARSHEALRRSEAELATGVPVASSAGNPVHLAARLEAVLKGGAEAIGCQAAALYLLDPATTELKLRSCWGLSADRLTEPARVLQGAVADLEALTGSAVALEDRTVMGAWNVPEPCGAAVCVPVSTTTTILGTLWMFAEDPRPFDDKQTNLIEIIAGRLAADLQHESLLAEGATSVGLRRDVDGATRLQQSQLPRAAPLVEGWQVAGRTYHADGLGGDFHDWCMLADGRLAVALGGAHERGAAAALTSQTLRTALRAHAAHESNGAKLLALANQTMWDTSAGDQFAAALVASIGPRSGKVAWVSAGQIGAVVVGPERCESLSRPGVPLGVQPDVDYQQHETVLATGEVIVLYTDRAANVCDPAAARPLEKLLAESLLSEADVSSERLVDRVQELLMESAADRAGTDEPAGHTVIIIRRTKR